MINKKSQSAIELSMIITLMFLIFFIFFMLMADKIVDVQEDANLENLDDLAKIIKEELVLANGVEDGYFRTFEIPQTLNGLNFSVLVLGGVAVNHTELILSFVDSPDELSHVERLPKSIIGNLTKGVNTISKNGGIICINNDGC